MAVVDKRAALVWLAIAIGAAGVVFGGAAVAGAISAHSQEITVFRGARLGMSARDVRDRFEPLGPGRWQSAAEASDMILAWASEAGDARARFEFHSGMLVAIRANLPAGNPLASGAPIALSPAAVLTRGPPETGEGTLLTILARDCPTHAAEVQRVLAAKQ